MTSFRRRVAVALRRYGGTRRSRVAVVIATIVVGASYETNRWRNQQLQDLALARDVLEQGVPRHLMNNATRTGLMGTSIPGAQSVKEELDTIRQWHQARGFHGGLVLREPRVRLFASTETEQEDEEEVFDLKKLRQRECYYLYYEIRSDGEIRQQIFCRGTTLLADVFTCLQSWWTWDEELHCRFHNGFKSHADRLIKDVEPLLAPPTHPRATVELCGHSLGGAVAFIVAMKLKRRGYNVIRVTSVGAPRSCHKEALPLLSDLLPPESFRIEDDCDPVPYLPPFGAHLGNKLWFVSEGTGASPAARFVPLPQSPSWVDSVWVNLRLFDTLLHMNKRHRVPNYVSQLKQLVNDMEE